VRWFFTWPESKASGLIAPGLVVLADQPALSLVDCPVASWPCVTTFPLVLVAASSPCWPAVFCAAVNGLGLELRAQAPADLSGGSKNAGLV